MSNIEYQTQSHVQILNVEISNIKLNPTFKSNVEYRISNSIQHSNRMSSNEYQTKSNIHVEYRISNSIQHSNRMSNIEYQSQSHI